MKNESLNNSAPEDFWIPMIPRKQIPSILDVFNAQDLGESKDEAKNDLEYFRSNLFNALKLPKEFFNSNEIDPQD